MANDTKSPSGLKDINLYKKEEEKAQVVTMPWLIEALDELQVNWLKKIVILSVGDLVYCTRQAAFRNIKAVSENQYQDQNKYLMGRDLNIQLQQNLLARYPGKFEFEKQVQYNCSNYYSNLGHDCKVYVVGRIDAFNKEIGPLEFKTSNSTKKITKPNPFDIQQTKYYMAMTNSTTAVLVYYQLDPKFADDRDMQFSIRITEEELYEEHEKLIRNALSLCEAISTRRPEIASHIAYDPNFNWKCGSCPYSKECMNIRVKTNGFNFNPE